MRFLTPSDIFDRLALEPEPVKASLQQFRSRACAQQYRLPYAQTQEFLREPRRVLDWGCGNGYFSYFLWQAGHRVDSYAFGAPSPMIRHLQERSERPVTYSAGIESEPVKLPYADGTFDAVFSIGVLEHVREFGGNELESLREIGRVLRPDGLFFCFHFPNRLSWIEALTTVFRSRHHHAYRYTKKDILRLADAAGFRVLEMHRYNALPRNVFASLGWGRNSRLLARSADKINSVQACLLKPFCQNYGVVACKLLKG